MTQRPAGLAPVVAGPWPAETSGADDPIQTAGAMAAGTPVLTLDGVLPVEHLLPGDRLITRDGAAVLRRLLPCRPARLVRLTAAALTVDGTARGQPVQDLLVAAETVLWLRDWRAQAMTGRRPALVTAERLVDGAFIRAEPGEGRILWRAECDRAVVVYAGGAELGLAGRPAPRAMATPV